MSLSIWDYVRRRTCEAMLAGFHDALDYLERQDQALLINAAAKSLRNRLHELTHNGGRGNGGNGNGGNGGNGNGGNAHGQASGGQHGGAQAAPQTPPATSPGQPKPLPQQQPLPGIHPDAPQGTPDASLDWTDLASSRQVTGFGSTADP